VETLTAIEERNRIAREMHDTIGHYLTVSAVQLEGAQRLIDSDPIKSKEIIGTAHQQVREALSALRQTVGRLREPIELELTLSQAMKRLTESFQSATSIPVSLDISPNFPIINTNEHLVIYRTAQEALTNIQRHAQANKVDIMLSATTSKLHFSIIDDGIGFVESQQLDGFGLLGIRERVREVNGKIHLHSIPNQGTKIILEIPRQSILGDRNA
jgi:signal transduction histidine kinase